MAGVYLSEALYYDLIPPPPLTHCYESRNQVGKELSYRPASPCSLATQFQTRFLESTPRPIAGLRFPTLGPKLDSRCWGYEPSRHRVVVPARQPMYCSLATQFQTRFLESIPNPIRGQQFRTLYFFARGRGKR